MDVVVRPAIPSVEIDAVSDVHATRSQFAALQFQITDIQIGTIGHPQFGAVIDPEFPILIGREHIGAEVHDGVILKLQVAIEGQGIGDGECRVSPHFQAVGHRQGAPREVGARVVIHFEIDAQGGCRARAGTEHTVVVHVHGAEREVIIEGQRGVVQLDAVTHGQRGADGAEGLVHEAQLVADGDVAIRCKGTRAVERAARLDGQVADVEGGVSGDGAVDEVDRGVASRGQQGTTSEIEVGGCIVHFQRAVDIDALGRAGAFE